jgi:exodeoxyribonuclease V gamma subunit
MSLQTGIAIIHGNKLESLVKVAEHWLKTNPLSPLESDIVLMYNHGVGQWFKQHLAQTSALGICAGLEVMLPSVFVWQMYRTILGEQIPKEQPLAKHPLTWRLYRLLPTLINKADFAHLAQFLTDDENHLKRHQLAEKLANLFDQYQMYRADWLLDWENENDILRDGHHHPQPIPPPQRWQAQLWRDILQDLSASEKQNASRSSVHGLFINAMQQITAPPAHLPQRIIALGIPTLAQQHLEVLAQLGHFCQIVLFVTNPCQHYWADIIEDKELLNAQSKRQRKKANIPNDLSDEDMHFYAHPLLAAWGKQGRDYIRLLDQFDERHAYENWPWAANKIDFFEAYVTSENASLLHRLQQTILDLEPTPKQKIVIKQADTSLSFHIAHSPQREIEILHDQLLAIFNDNTPAKSRLKPRDVLVMVPDINVYAPHIHAVFGQMQPNDKRFIPYRVSDQHERGHHSLVTALAFLLNLPNERFTASQIRWLLDVPAIRNRLNIDAQSIPKLYQWIEGANIRWGLNAQHRRELGMTEGLDANTWQFGLNRMLLGYAVGSGAAFAGIEPYEEIGGLDAQWLGHLCDLINLLQTYHHKLNHALDYESWYGLLSELLADFFQPNDENERKTLESLQVALKQWVADCKRAHLSKSDRLPRGVVCESWLASVDESHFQKIFLSGNVHFCTLMPMRSIPFSVICVLGMNDGDYPRTHPVQSFDLMSLPGQYRPGDRSRRQDDQYVFLEALLSARQQLYVSWVGRNVRDNSKIPPSVLISQLRETIDRYWQLPEKQLLAEITFEHPLQPFSRQYLSNTQPSRLFTYTHEWFAQNNSLDASNDENTVHTNTKAPATVSLETLGRFLKAPVKTFCTQTLNIYFETPSDILSDDEPFTLNGLETFLFKDTLLEQVKNHPQPPNTAFFQHQENQLIAKGQFPLGHFAQLQFEKISQPVKHAWARYQDYLTLWPQECDPLAIHMDFTLKEDITITLTGHVQNRRQNNKTENALLFLTAQELKKGNRIKYHNFCIHWIHHLAACASGLNVKSFVIGADCIMTLQPIDSADARDLLTSLVQAYHSGLQGMLPIAIQSAFAYLLKQELSAAKKIYDDEFNGGEVDQDPYLNRFYPTFDALNQSNAFVEWATTLYEPLYQHLHEVI